MGVEVGLKYAESSDSVEVLYITEGNKLYMSEGFSSVFTLKNTEYHIEEKE